MKKEKIIYVTFHPENLDPKFKFIKFENGEKKATLRVSSIEDYVKVDEFDDNQGDLNDDGRDVIFRVSVYSPIVNGQILHSIRESASNLEYLYTKQTIHGSASKF